MIVYYSHQELQTDLEGLMFWASFTDNPFPEAIPSHIRIRTSTADEFANFQSMLQNNKWISTHKTQLYNGKTIFWARLNTPINFNNNPNQPIYWLEFTPPNKSHNDGPDAIIFKVPNLKEPHIVWVSTDPPITFRFQALSAEDILNA